MELDNIINPNNELVTMNKVNKTGAAVAKKQLNVAKACRKRTEGSLLINYSAEPSISL